MSEEGTKLKKEQRQESILETALELMSESSIDSTTMRGIAKAEGISETLLYRFFKNKNELLFAIFEAKAVEIANSIQELFETTKGMIPDPVETLPLICKLVRKRIDKNQKTFNLIIKERKTLKVIFEAEGGFQAILKDKIKIRTFMGLMNDIANNQSLTNYFQRCKDAGNLRADLDPAHCANLFLKIIWPTPMIGTKFALPFGHMPMDSQSQEIFKTNMKILLYGLVPDEKH
ncbi:MAG: TetR/AcrR family transcriptional regulator [Candidatus Heimdallarchaeota archaeon]